MLRCWQKSQQAKELRAGTGPLQGTATASARSIAWASALGAQRLQLLSRAWRGCRGGKQTAGIYKLVLVITLTILRCCPASRSDGRKRGSLRATMHCSTTSLEMEIQSCCISEQGIPDGWGVRTPGACVPLAPRAWDGNWSANCKSV